MPPALPMCGAQQGIARMKVALKVAGMTCQHCVRAVTGAIQALDPQAQVAVDLAAGAVAVETTLPRDQVAAAVAAEGYQILG
jgi:copper chaperone